LIENLDNKKIIDFPGKKVLFVCAIDRFKMAEAFVSSGCDVTIGDIIFALNIPFPIRSIKAFKRIVRILLPAVSCLPYKLLYPVGEDQNKGPKASSFAKYYENVDIIAGDFLYIKKYMPQDLEGKIIITNTVTKEDANVLKDSGVDMLITSTPELNGRSFGTNVMEAVLIAASGKNPNELSEQDYLVLIDKLKFLPRIQKF
jgi:hypothetical protein